MVVLTSSNGASFQPLLLTKSSHNHNSVKTTSPGKTMSSSATTSLLKTKSPLLEKSVKLVPLAVKRNSTTNHNNNNNDSPMTNGNQMTTTTDGDTDNLPSTKSAAVVGNGSTRQASFVAVEAPSTASGAAAVAVVAVTPQPPPPPPKRRKGRPPKSAATLKASNKAKNAAEKSMTPKQSKVLLDNVLPFITCTLCKGYLIDATTIVECLHTFCHSCIMIHLRQKQYCPCCELMINKSKPNIKPDAIRQAIVYKLVPGLYEKEILRRQDFYRAHPDDAKLATPEQRGEDTENLIFSPNENISLSIEYADMEETDDLDGVWLKPKFLQCPASFTVNMLSKFIVMKIGMDANKFLVDISYKVKTIVLADYYTLMDVAYIYTWKREAPMRFYFSVRTKETSHQELPEVPFRRSPGISSNPALPPMLADADLSSAQEPEQQTQVNSGKDNATSDKPECSSSVVAVPTVLVEPKLKLKLKVDESGPRVSDKKRVVYMVQNNTPSDNGPQISAAAAYSLLPHESTAVGVNSPTPVPPMSNNKSTATAATKQLQQQKQPLSRAAEEGTPRYRLLVEKENAKMKKLMQSLSEEKKMLKLRKREAMKEASSSSSSSSSAMSLNTSTSLKMKITKSDSGLMVIQNSVEEQPRDVLSVIDSVANCDVNDVHKKSLFLQSFELAPKKPKSIPAEKEKTKPEQKSTNKTPSSVKTPSDLKKSISFGFSSYEFESTEDEDKDTEITPLRSSTPKAAAVTDTAKPTKSPSNPSPGEKGKKSSTPLKRSASDEKLSPGQAIPRKKFSSYVKIAPKEQAILPKLQPKIAPKTIVPEKCVAAKPTATPNKPAKVNNIPHMTVPSVMAPPPVPPPPQTQPQQQQQQQQQRPTANGSIYAFLQPNPSPKSLFKPMNGPGIPNMSGYSHSQFQTMPSPVYMTNANAGSTPIYSPNSPQYAPNFSLPQNQQFKYTKFPTYMNFSLASQIPMPAPSPITTTTSASTHNPSSSKVPGLFAGPKTNKKEPQKVSSPATGNINKGVSYLNKLPPPPIFSPSSGMSITTTTTTSTGTGPGPIGSSPPPLVVLPKRSPEAESSGKRKNTSSPNMSAKPQSPATATTREDPPEKQRKVQSLLDSCNITFPSSLSITIANETEDGDKSGLHNNKLKNPVNNYIEILKIPSGDPSANCSTPDQPNNKFPMSAANVIQQQQQQQANNNPGTFGSASQSSSSAGIMKPPTPPITTAPTMKLGSGSGMSITPAITSNIMHLIKGNGPKDASKSASPSPVVANDQKRKSPPLEVAPVKRPTPSPPKPPTNNVMGPPQSALKPVTSTNAAAEAKKQKCVPKLMPKLNPIEKVVVVPKSQPNPVAPTNTPATNLNAAAVAAAAAITSANETFQREFLKFAKDKPDGKSTIPSKVSVSHPLTSAKSPMEVQKPISTGDTTPKGQRKSPVKIKPKSSSGGVQQQQKIQPAPNNKPQLPELRMNLPAPAAVAPFPLANQQQQQHQQQQQQQEYAAAFLKMAIQHQQKIAALQQQSQQYPTVLGDLMMPSPMAMFGSSPFPQLQPQQQLNSLIQQAFYQEHLERMKRAGKEALEQYEHNIKQEANSKAPSPKPPKGQLAGKTKQGGQVNKGPSPPVQTSKPINTPSIKDELKKSPLKIIGEGIGSKSASQEELKKPTAQSPKPLQMNNNTNNKSPSLLKQEDKKDVKA